MLRPATEADLDVMREWRNQEPNRLASINSHEISAAEHRAWWTRTSADPTRRVLVFEREDGPAGVVSFFDLDLDAPRRSGAWGFYLDAERLEAREELVPAWMSVMREATRYAFDELRLDDLHGEVLADNVAVRNMNRLFRFVEGAGQPREVDGRRIVVIPILLRRESRRRS
ncbi:GNAT family N-acetyltransferase [Actinophytocola sp. KF-1]